MGGRLIGAGPGKLHALASWPNCPGFNGMFGEDFRITLGDVSDGTSNTMLVGEKAWELPNPVGSPFACQAANAFTANYHNGQLTNRNSLGAGSVPINYANGQCNFGFSSRHTGGAQFVRVDGSVHFVSQNIDLRRVIDTLPGVWQNSTYEQILARNDGNVINGEF
jgi:hypothetical protein